MRAVLREPLAHFLLLGALLFAWFEWRGAGQGPGSTRIEVTTGRIEHLTAGFTRTWQRPPSESELKSLIDDYVREEIAAREARAMGLDGDDTVIRRRLRQKLEFLAEDILTASPPTDAELQAWMDGHPQEFRRDPKVSFRQVALSRDRRGGRVEADARALLAELRRAGPEADIESLGDMHLLPRELDMETWEDVARRFGEMFADRLLETPQGAWAGPLESGYGLHLVLVRERREGALPRLEEVRPAVERELLAARRQEQLQALYDRLLEKYTVEIVWPRPPETAAAATP